MSVRKVIFAIALALVWLTASNGCALAAAVPGFPPPCACDAPGKPCGQGCHTCLTLKTGTNLGALTPVAVPARSWCEDERLRQWLREMVMAAFDTGKASRPMMVWEPPAPPALMLAVALPVRGPTGLA